MTYALRSDTCVFGSNWFSLEKSLQIIEWLSSDVLFSCKNTHQFDDFHVKVWKSVEINVATVFTPNPIKRVSSNSKRSFAQYHSSFERTHNIHTTHNYWRLFTYASKETAVCDASIHISSFRLWQMTSMHPKSGWKWTKRQEIAVCDEAMC